MVNSPRGSRPSETSPSELITLRTLPPFFNDLGCGFKKKTPNTLRALYSVIKVGRRRPTEVPDLEDLTDEAEADDIDDDHNGEVEMAWFMVRTFAVDRGHLRGERKNDTSERERIHPSFWLAIHPHHSRQRPPPSFIYKCPPTITSASSTTLSSMLTYLTTMSPLLSSCLILSLRSPPSPRTRQPIQISPFSRSSSTIVGRVALSFWVLQRILTSDKMLACGAT